MIITKVEKMQMLLLLLCWILRATAFVLILIILSCGASRSDSKAVQVAVDYSMVSTDFCNENEMEGNALIDTILIQTSDELIKNIGSNKVLNLVGRTYNLNATLVLDHLENLKITGKKSTKIKVLEENTTVISLKNTQNITLENLVIGYSESQDYTEPQGTVRIEQSSNVNIADCKILGIGNVGLITKEVCNFKFENSEITKCTALIFELEKSQKIQFENAMFQNNNLEVSVLGGFTNTTKEVIFSNCIFLNNSPIMKGNPAFNFYRNDDNLEEKIIFRNCIFKNNQGYKWYGEKIKLEHCNIDSTDFTNWD